MTVCHSQLSVVMSKEEAEKLSDTNDGAIHTELKRPLSDSVLLQPTQGTSSKKHPKKPKVTKRRKKRDPKEPQKPVTAYILFMKDKQSSIKMQYPNAELGEVSKIVAAAWKALDPDDKAVYTNRAEEAKKDLEAYKAKVG